jgi:hypothetical protein
MPQPQTTSLFGDIAVSPAERKENRLSERRRKAHQAYASTADAWKRSTYEFAVEIFLPATETFLFENLTEQYETFAKANGKTLTVEKRAFSGLQARLIREGFIEKIVDVMPYRSNGNQGHFYRSLKFRG